MLAPSLTTIFIAGLFTLVRATQFQVTVGGPGILQFSPEFVVSIGVSLSKPMSSADIPVECECWGYNPFLLQAGESHRITVFPQQPVPACRWRLRLRIVSIYQMPILQTLTSIPSVPVAANNTDGPFQAAQYTVTNEDPVWIFCRQANHCQQGMVFAVNPGDQFDTFKANALGNNAANSSASATTTASSANATSTSATGSASVTASASISTNTTVSAASTSTTASATATFTDVAVVNVTTTVTVSETASASASSSAASSQSTYAEHIVIVGADGKLAFEPSNITANVGDIVTFLFTHANHSATQSSFSKPCNSLAESGQTGFDSGL